MRDNVILYRKNLTQQLEDLQTMLTDKSHDFDMAKKELKYAV